MPRPRTPIAQADLTGASRKNPKRYASRRRELQPTGPLGQPPDHMSAGAKAAWLELAATVPPGVLKNSDRWLLEIASYLMDKFRKEGTAGRYGLTGAELAQLHSMLAKMGMSPSDRSKVGVPEKSEEQDNPFATLDAPSPRAVN